MFTGIVEEIGEIVSIERGASSLKIGVKCAFAGELSLGESVAVNGACMTACALGEKSFFFDVTPESFRRTSLKDLREGSGVNLERAMKADGRFGGHLVSGHIDTTGVFLGAQTEGNAMNAHFFVDGIAAYIVEKGSVALDGVSLTIASVRHENGKTHFSVALIPHTWENTTLCKKRSGDTVNVEFDIIGKYVESILLKNQQKNESSQDFSAIMENFPNFH